MTTKNLRLTCFRLAEVSPHIPEERSEAIVVELSECNLESLFKHFTDRELVNELNRRHQRAREVKAALLAKARAAQVAEREAAKQARLAREREEAERLEQWVRGELDWGRFSAMRLRVKEGEVQTAPHAWSG